MKYLKEDFLDIIKNKRITPVFQPIVSLEDGKIIGYEALSRIENPRVIKDSGELFKLACVYGKIWELEQLCRSKILEKFHTICPDEKNIKLFLNVNPMVIHDEQFQKGITIQYLKEYGLGLENIVFEITENSAVDDMKGFLDTIRHYKSQGYQVAIDDAGSCYSGLNLICDIVPHYLKLDFALIHNIHKDMVKYAMVKALVEFSNLTNICLIAEGIQCEQELKVLLKLGVHCGQGFFLREPEKKIQGLHKNALDVIEKFSTKRSRFTTYSGDKENCVILFELDSTKAYRVYCSKYGEEQGEKILRVMRETIDDNLLEKETAYTLSEDTHIVIMEKENYKMRCETILTMFRNRIQNYYTTKDWENGYMEGIKKHGEKKRFSLLNLHTERVI